MKLLVILLATVVLYACDKSKYAGGVGVVSASPILITSPIPPVALQLSPAILPVNVINSIACPIAPAFSTLFDLTILPQAGTSVTVERVTFRLIDGSAPGLPITFPGVQLRQMFGSTLVRDFRAFPFRPFFGCGLTFSRTLAADVDLVDSTGRAMNVSALGRFQ